MIGCSQRASNSVLPYWQREHAQCMEYYHRRSQIRDTRACHHFRCCALPKDTARRVSRSTSHITRLDSFCVVCPFIIRLIAIETSSVFFDVSVQWLRHGDHPPILYGNQQPAADWILNTVLNTVVPSPSHQYNRWLCMWFHTHVWCTPNCSTLRASQNTLTK
jgi:hypothetical protein